MEWELQGCEFYDVYHCSLPFYELTSKFYFFIQDGSIDGIFYMICVHFWSVCTHFKSINHTNVINRLQ